MHPCGVILQYESLQRREKLKEKLDLYFLTSDIFIVKPYTTRDIILLSTNYVVIYILRALLSNYSMYNNK